MRKSGAFVWLLLFSGLTCYAQDRVDSLQELLTQTTSDSVRINLLIQLNEAIEFQDIDKSREYLDRAKELAERKGWNWALLKVYGAQSYTAMLLGDYSTSLQLDNERLALAQEAQDTAQIRDALNYMGDSYLAQGEYDEAYFAFSQALKISRQHRDTLMMAVTTHNIGCVFKELGQYELALQHLAFAQGLSRQLKDYDGEAYYLDEVGDLYARQRNYDMAEATLLESLHVTRKLKIRVLEPHILAHLAHLYLERNELKKAATYWDSTLWLHQQTKNTFGIAKANVGRGQLLIKQNEYTAANELLQTSLTTAKSIHARTLEIECLKQLALLNEQRGDLKAAYGFFKNYKALQDSLFSEKMLGNLFRDQMRNETEIRDSEIAALSRTGRLQRDELAREELIRNILVVVATLTTFLLFAVYRSGQSKLAMNKLLVRLQAETEARSKELEELNKVKDKFFSVISHDLRSPINTLAGILDLVEKGAIRPEEFPIVTKELRAQFDHTRTLVNNLLDWALLQMDKLKIVEEKVGLWQLADENFRLLSSMQLKNMKFVNDIPKDCSALADKNMANLVFRNLIMNAIKFTDEGGTISIRAYDRNSHWCIAVEDNGVGIQPEVQRVIFEKTSGFSTRGTANEKGTGLGLILCREFVERNGGTIWLKSEVGQGSTFFFTLKKA